MQGLLAIGILAVIYGIVAILMRHEHMDPDPFPYPGVRRPMDKPSAGERFLTMPCSHCGKTALREPGAYGYYAECAECGETTYTGP